ncbi:phosphatase PAP2 family protein [Clostridium sp. LBM24168]
MQKVMKNFRKNILYLSPMIAIPIVNIVYLLLDNSSRGYYVLTMNVDRYVPFVKEFILVYWIWYPFIIISLMFFCFINKKIYYKVLLTIILGMIICYIVYLFFQTNVPRPAVYGNDFLSDLVRDTYKIDKPFNCCPSIHVLTTYAVMRGSLKLPRENVRSTILIWIVGILIILSTQFIKQHVILDLATAMMLGEIIYRVIAKQAY